MNRKDLLFYLMIGVVVVLSVYMIWWTHSEGEKCMLQPLVYGVSQMSSTQDDEISCSCSSKLSQQVLIFNKNNISYSDASHVDFSK